MHTNKFSVIAAVLLFVFSIGTAYDPCGESDFGSVSSQFSSSDSSTPSNVPSDGADCHCLCHFVFSPESHPNFGPVVLFQSFVFPIKDLPKATFIPSILRPPISVL